MPTTYHLLPTAYCLLPTALLPTAYCPSAYCPSALLPYCPTTFYLPSTTILPTSYSLTALGTSITTARLHYCTTALLYYPNTHAPQRALMKNMVLASQAAADRRTGVGLLWGELWPLCGVLQPQV